MSGNFMEIVAVRHGETVANFEGIIQGHSNSQLNDLGRQQAEAVALRLQHEKFDAAFVSDLDRTKDTAQAILQYHPELAVTYTTMLREWHLGVLQNQRYTEMSAEHQLLVDILRTSETVPPIPGGETIEEFQQRVSDFLEELAANYMGKRLLLVSHGGTIQRMLRHCTGLLAAGNFRPACGNTCISVFRKRTDGHWQLISWNDTAHLTQFLQPTNPLPI